MIMSHDHDITPRSVLFCSAPSYVPDCETTMCIRPYVCSGHTRWMTTLPCSPTILQKKPTEHSKLIDIEITLIQRLWIKIDLMFIKRINT